jgi:hypothetical protein
MTNRAQGTRVLCRLNRYLRVLKTVFIFSGFLLVTYRCHFIKIRNMAFHRGTLWLAQFSPLTRIK